ncbi:MAG: hypothetical protein J3K34DRAFT_523626 [Monoraphidium minutum]|nr:MAG: hypothetical protein J3K34DRAFT_523626 [Monoraphidium minutum]
MMPRRAAAAPRAAPRAAATAAAAAAGGGEEAAEVVIIGSGFSGLGAAVQLLKARVTSLVILERAAAPGGTWRDNAYPGAACDIPSHLYCFSFAPNPRFSRVYPGQQEIYDYLQSVAAKHGLLPKIRFGADVRKCAWDGATATYALECADGRRFRGRFAVFGAGPLKDPKWPDIPGLDSFGGALIHSCRWPPGADRLAPLRGKRVAIIGTGASAAQIIPPAAAAAAEMHVVQRTPAWVAPRADSAYSPAARAAFRHVPLALRLHRLQLYLAHEVRYPLLMRGGPLAGRVSAGLAKRLGEYIRSEVPDAARAAALTPRYAPGCKRMLLSSDFYPAMARPNVHLHTQPAAAATPTGLVLADGTALENLDAVVCATGFTVDAPLAGLEVIGQGGIALSEVWGDRPKAYLGSTVPGFPNLFFVLGPNTGLGHNSVVLMAEAQISYAVQGILAARGRGASAWATPRQAALDAFVSEMDARHKSKVWATGGCASWYLTAGGENFSLWPGSTLDFMRRVRRFDAEAYEFGDAPPAAAGAAGGGGKEA